MLKSDDPKGYREFPARRPKSSGANTANKLRSPPGCVSYCFPSRVEDTLACFSSLHFVFSTMISRLFFAVAGVFALSGGLASAHGSHSNDGQPPSNDWATRHMMGKDDIQRSMECIIGLHDC
jgi:hypothetical protein